ncbi:hypothetical protein BGZ96_004193 [Linnemannia gamsii]|uniref:Uncharacterized protein n=1 Tax=Linnemannia gamsii TaxID=64522 RepID=A0ABQ7JIH5_9FUNG|nr:hypothetical protein BGZ96_004193 [Linnemannia gamsii]
MDGSSEEHEQDMVRFQNTVMALLGYSRMGSERLYQIEDNIDSLKADLSTSLKHLTDNNKDLSARQHKILDDTAKLMNKTEGLLDRMEKFTFERPGWQTAPDMIVLSPAEIAEIDAFLDDGLVDTEPKAHPSDYFGLLVRDVDVGSLRRCDETSALSPGYMGDGSEESSGDDTDVTLPPIRSPSIWGEKPFQEAGQDIDPPFFTLYDMRGSNTVTLALPLQVQSRGTYSKEQ